MPNERRSDEPRRPPVRQDSLSELTATKLHERRKQRVDKRCIVMTHPLREDATPAQRTDRPSKVELIGDGLCPVQACRLGALYDSVMQVLMVAFERR